MKKKEREKTKKTKYRKIKKTPHKKPESIESQIRISGKGVGYMDIPDTKESAEIKPSFLNTALHKDTVRILLHPKIRGKIRTGEVVEIIRRSKQGFAGILNERKGVYILTPSDPKMYTNIIIEKESVKKSYIGKKVFAVITKWVDPRKTPSGKITEFLGEPHENETEMRAIALERGFSSTFPSRVEEEAQKLKEEGISEKEIRSRKDFRNITTFTIDPEDAKDFDDALSVRYLDDETIEIGVHIADVSHYVRQKSELDKEAFRRGTSVYLVDRTIPMLPEILSNDLCSLNQNENKLTFSAVFTFKNEEIIKEWFGKTVIYSDRRFAYEDVQKILDAGNGEFYRELNDLNIIAKKQKQKRFEDGAVFIEQDEIKFKLDEKGVPVDVYRKIRKDAHKLIEEFMLLANRSVARNIASRGKKGAEKIFVYRIHDKPDTDRMKNLVSFLKKLGYRVKTKAGLIPPNEMNRILMELEGKEEKDAIQRIIVRTMAKAIYSTRNIGHYGLAFEYYTHFTSPIRRYPDIIVHRLLEDYLEGKDIGHDKKQKYEKISSISSLREKEAADAERESIKYKQVEYMSYRIGKEFEGVITSITSWGIYIEEKRTKCEGMVKLSDVGDDYYIYDEKNLMLVGEKTKNKFKIGDRVKIRVKHTDLDKKIIDYELV